MGVFPVSAPNISKVAPINMISFVGSYDPWVIPLPLEIESLGDTMPLSLAELSYSVIQSAGEFVYTISGTSSIEGLNQYFFPQWDKPLSLLHDFLNDYIPSDGAILEVLTLFDQPWVDSHHRSSLIPNFKRVEETLQNQVLIAQSQLPSISYNMFSE